MKLNIGFMLIILTLAAFSHADLIQPISRTPLRPFSINQNYMTDYSFSVYIPSAIPYAATIEVEFPQPYQLASACKAYIKIGTAPFQIYSCTKPSFSKYIVSIGQIATGEYEIVFENVQNPSSYPASSNFKIRTYMNQNVLIDSNEYFDSVPFLPASGTSRNASVENTGYTSVSLGSKFDWKFGLKKPLAKGDSIKFNFPEGFYFLKPACFHRNSGTYTQTELLHNNRSVICQGFQDNLAAGVYQTVTIIGVVNPEYSGYFKGFYLETLEGVSANVYERITVPNFIKIDPGKVNINIKSASVLLATNTTHMFELMFENDVPATGEVWIIIPPGFRYLAANCTLLRPLEAQLDREVTCELAANKTGYIIRGFTGISASQSLAVAVVAENPASSSDYNIHIFSFSTTYNAMIDEGYDIIHIETQYGASKFFKSHSLRFTRRLKHDETGPLEFTFFLNIPLPATASSFKGEIIIDIRPKIDYPPIGSLRCFFYNTVPASYCNWDNTTYADRTQVTIRTPTTDPYFQTEIPITITTEDAVGTYGVKLPQLIQRYKFYIYFWRDGDAKEHEVYYEDYIPDPIEMASSAITLTIAPLQYNEEAFFLIEWTNDYMGLGTDYFIELEFDHSNSAWDYNLGWGALPFYGRYNMPCLIENLGSIYKCLLNPGGSASSNSTIQIIGLSAIPYNNVAKIRLPKILLGSSGTAGLRFTLYENTPGETTHRIPIMYRDFFLSPTTSSGLSFGTPLTVTLGSNKPDIDTTLSFSFTSTLSDPRYIIYEYPSLYSINTQSVVCGAPNYCHIFSTPVRWIVFEITSTQGTSASTPLGATTIHTPPYIGTYQFKARTEKANSIGDKKQQGPTITAGALTVTFALDTSVTQLNKNTFTLFKITFTTITKMYADGSILLTFTGLTVPDADDFYCEIQITLPQLSTVGVICEKMTSTTMKLYNLDVVPASTAVTLVVQLLTNTATSTNCKVETFYDRAATSSKLIDTGNIGLTLTFVLDNFSSSSIISDRSGEIVRAGQYGAITLTITPTNTYSSALLYINFGTGFSISQTSPIDIPYCKLNNIRVRCNFVTGTGLTVRFSGIGAAYLTANTLLTIYITTDYSDPRYKGFKAPSTPGYKDVDIQISDSSFTPTIGEQIGGFIYVYPSSIPEFTVTPTCTTAGVYTIFVFTFKLKTALNSNSHASSRGRIYIEFPTGSENFDNDLGTGLSTGSLLGCIQTGLSGTVKCRLVKAPATGLPAAIEISGFTAVSAGTSITVTVGKIKNPPLATVGEYTFGLRTEHVSVATGDITPLEYAQYNLWHRVTPASPAPSTYTSGYTVSFQGGSVPGQSSRTMDFRIYSNVALASGGTDYYIIELPSDILVSSTLTCPSSADPGCYSIPDIGWVVYPITSSVGANTNTDGTVATVTLPASLKHTDYTITSYIWKNTALDHYMTHTVQSSGFSSFTGTFTSATAAVNSYQLVKSRGKTEIVVTFTTATAVPNTGTFEIRFPSGVVPKPYCKNSPSMGSVLASTTGRIACTIQSNSWLITNFDAIAASSKIVIYGFVDLPSTAGATSSIELYSYSNQHSTSIATNGDLIDKLTSGLTLTIQSYNTLALDASPSFLMNQPIIAQSSYYRPLIFDFTLNSVTITSSSNIKITVSSAASAFSTTLPNGGALVCSFQNLATGDYVGCDITSVSPSSILTYTLTPTETLSSSVNYRGTITTVFANSGNDGILLPSVAGTYQVSFYADVSGSSVDEKDVNFLEIVPSKFSALTIKNYVITPSEEDVIDVSLTVGASITTTQRLVVELPTVFNSTNMFDEDLGLGLYDGQDKLCEVITSTPASITLSCVFQKGNRYAKTPAAIVLYGFSAAFTSLRFAFTVKNPAVTSPTVIPMTIYTVQNTNPFLKTYYQYVEKGVIVSATTATPATEGTAPTYSASAIRASSTLTIPVTIATALAASDYYVIKVPQMGLTATVSTSSTITINSVNTNGIVLPKNRFIILNPTASVAAGSYSVAITGIVNAEQGLSAANMAFTGYATHFASMTHEKITYSTPAASFTGLSSFSTAPTLSLSNTAILQDSILSITVTAVFTDVKSVIIDVPNDLTLKEDCYEAYTNAVEIIKCSIDTTNNYILVTVEDKTGSLALKINAIVTNGATSGSITTGFSYYLYTTVETDPTNAAGQRYAVTNLVSGLTLVSSTGTTPPYITLEYVPYVENRFNFPVSGYGEIKFRYTTPATLDSTLTIKIYLPSIFTFDNTAIGDMSSTQAVIISEPNDIPAKHVLVTATYSTGTLSFVMPSGITISSGRTVTFRITEVAKAGNNVGIKLPSSYTASETNVIMETYTTTPLTLTYTAQLGTLYLSTAPPYTTTLNVMTKATGELNVWEFTMNSVPATIENLYIDFPTQDEYGNTLFDTSLGGLVDRSTVPCAASGTGFATGLTNPECIFFVGGASSAQPAKIWVRGLVPTGSNIILYIIGPKNPTQVCRVYTSIRFYTSTAYQGTTLVAGFVTNVGTLQTQATDSSYIVTSNKPYLQASTYTFKTGVGIPVGAFLLVKLDPSCSSGSNSGTSYFATGAIGSYVLRKVTTALSASNTYPFTNFICDKLVGTNFQLYHINSLTATTGVVGEVRSSDYGDTSGTRDTNAAVSLTGTNTYEFSGLAYSSSLKGRLSFNFDAIKSFVTTSNPALVPVLELEFSGYYFNTLSACDVLGGLDLISSNNPIACSVPASNKIKITNFKTISGSSVPVVLYVSFTSASSYSTGSINVRLYASNTHYGNADPQTYSTISSLTASTPSGVSALTIDQPLTFSTAPYPGRSGNVVLDLTGITFSTTYSANSGDLLRIKFESTLNPLTSTSCSSSGTDFSGCTASTTSGNNYIDIPIVSASYSGALSDVSVTFSATWPSSYGPYFLTVEIIDSTATTVYYATVSVPFHLKGTNVLSVTATPLHMTASMETEYKFSFSSIPIALDTTKIFSIQFANNVVNVNSLDPMDCTCTAATSCYFYQVGANKYIDMVVTSLAAFGSLDCYVPAIKNDATSDVLSAYILDARNRYVYFETSIGTLSYTSNSASTHTLNVPYPTAPILPSTSTTMSPTISSPGSYTTSSFIYINFGAAGPIPPSCGAAAIGDCRSYSAVQNIYVVRSGSTGSSTLTVFSSATVNYPSDLSEQAANYTVISQLVESSSIISYGTKSLTATDFVAAQTPVTLTASELKRSLFATMKLTFTTGSIVIPKTDGKIIITLTGITNIGNCYASVSKVPLPCATSGSTITISPDKDIGTSKQVEILFAGNNPASGTPTITLKGYSFYNANPVYNSLVLSAGSFTTPSYTANAGAYVPIANFPTFNLITKTINPTKVPIRLRFRLTNTLPANGRVLITLPSSQFSYNGNPIGYFRTYNNEFDYTEVESKATSVSGSQIIITTSTALAPLTWPAFYEVVLITDDATAPHFNKAPDNNQLIVVFDDGASTPTTLETAKVNTYAYKTTNFISATLIYYTTPYLSDPNTLIFTFSVASATTVSSTSLFEIELSSASSGLIKTGYSTADRVVTCGITSTLAKRSTSTTNPRCTLVHSTPPKIRIENYAAISSGTFSVMLYDLLNSIIAKDGVSYFDAVIRVTDVNAKSQSNHKLTRLFTVKSGSASAPTTASTFPTSSVTAYSTATILTKSFTWPATDSGSPSRLVVKNTGGSYKFKDTTNFQFLIGSTAQTILLDEVNNIFVVLATSPTLSASTPYSFKFQGTTFKTPTPYDNVADSIEFAYYAGGQNKRTYTWSGSYTALSPTSTTVTSGSCTSAINSIASGSGGNVECQLAITIPTTVISTISAIKIDLTNPSTNQYSTIYPFCEAYISSGSATVSTGQLICSRLDASSTLATLFVTGFSAGTPSTITVTFRMKTKALATLTADVSLQVLQNGGYYSLHKETGYSLSLPAAAYSNSINAPSKFSVRNYVTDKTPVSKKLPFKIVTNVDSALTATGSFKITFENNYVLQGGNSVPLCTLRDETTYGPPLLTSCSYDTTNKIYLLSLLGALSTTGRYVIEISSLQSDLLNDGVLFPSDNNRLYVRTQIDSATGTTLSIDQIFVAVEASPFAKFSIANQKNLAGGKMTQFEVNVQAAAATTADTASSENLLVLEFPTPLYDSDLGVSTTFGADNNPYYNGMLMPSIIASGLGSSTIAALHYGTSTEPARIVISKHTGLTTTLQTISLALIKNPAALKALRINVYLLQYPTNQAYPTVVYQASYVNYFHTYTWAGETAAALTWSFSGSNPGVQQTVSITFGTKSYGHAVTTTSKLYIKLKNGAKGFDYAAMTSTTGISCTGFTVEWFKDGYVFFLTPTSSLGTSISFSCSNFKLGSTIESITLETGHHDSGYYSIYASSGTTTISPLSSLPGETPTATRDTIGIDNGQSVNRYTLTYNTGSFTLKASGYLLINLPASRVVAVSGLTEYAAVAGLTDNTSGSPSSTIQVVVVSANSVKVSGYKDFKSSTDGVLTISLYLRNVNAGSLQFTISMYDENGGNIATSGSFNDLPVSSTPTASVGGSFGPFLTDAADIFVSQKYKIIFKLTVKTALTYATSSSFIITLPTGFTMTAGKEVCKYSVDSGAHWIRSPCTVSSGDLNVPLISGFDVSSNVLILLTTEDPDSTLTGVARPATSTTLYQFKIKSRKSATDYETVTLPYVVYPDPTAITLSSTWYNRASNDDSIIDLSFTTTAAFDNTHYFQLDLVTDDDISQVFPDDLGTGVTEKYTISDCAQYPSNKNLDTTKVSLDCKIARGKRSASPFIPAKVIIKIVSGTISVGTNIRVLIAKIRNPGGIPGGFVLNVMKPCRNDGFGCPLHRRREYKSFGVSSSRYQDPTVDLNGRASPTSSKRDLLMTDSTTTFTFKTLRNNVQTTDAIVIKYSLLNLLVTTECTAPSSAKCIHFPRIGWTFYQPAAQINAGNLVSFSLNIDNAFFYDRTNPTNFLIEPWTSGGVQQITYGAHPAYNLKVPTLQTDATQTDLANQYIVRNFDNILQISMTGIWRTANVRKIVVNTPSSYIAITNTYCMAGVDLTDISNANFIEFPCQVTGARQITLYVSDPTAFNSATHPTKAVVVFFRGFLPVNAGYGNTATSTITSFASYTSNYVIDENTQYKFYVSPTPTPIIRDVNLNLKSVNDRQARITDYVMFYAAVWPNTPYDSTNPITQLLFEVDNEYLYPSLANLVCMTKVVFKIQVSCTLKRKQGRTQIYVNPPPSYTHSPFLLSITNTAENLLFIAPSREGSFLFNLTYLNPSGQQIEKADSYMSISGEFVQSFTAEPIRTDPLIKTLYDFRFTTATRVTPQGFYEAGQAVYTQIVFLFQTYSPGYPLDLGTGLTDGSELSCVAAQGITLNKNKKLTCKLVYGTPTVHSKVIVTGYDAIPAGTSVQILIDDITTLATGVTSRVKLEIQSTYTATNEQYVFYNSLEVSPQVPTALANSATSTSLTVTRGGSSIVLRERSSYTVQASFASTLTAGTDYIVIDFPEYGYELEADYSNVVVSITSPAMTCQSWIMPRTNRIYIIPGSNVNGATTIQIDNIQNPSFYLSGSYTFTAKSVVSKKWKDDLTQSVSLSSTMCQLFSNEGITYNSTYIKMNENTYQISFTVLHNVPAAGSLAVLFDSHYNLRLSNPSCQLVQGFSRFATCVFELFSQQLVRIKLNGQPIQSGTFVRLNVINVNNPTDNAVPASITLQSYFDAVFDTTTTVCSKPITLPTFNSLTSIKCPVTIEPEINNANEVTDYIITLSCSGDIRNATTIDVGFPLDFLNRFTTDLSCSTNGNYMLQQCSVIAKTARVTVLISKPSIQQSLIVRIRGVTNPLFNGTYGPFDVNLYQYSVLYGALDSATSTTSVVILSNDNYVKTTNKLSLSIFPRNYGEKAAYYFSLPGIVVKSSPAEVYVTFDTAFSKVLGSSLECGTFTPQDQYGKNYALNYESLKNLQILSCSLVDDYKLKLQLSPAINILPNQVFNLFFYVKNIINPSLNSQTSYTFNLVFTASGSAVFSSQNSVGISFGLPPSLFQIKSFTTTDTNILSPATYTFTLQATSSLPASTTTSTKEYEIMLNLPASQYPVFSQGVQIVYSFPDTPQIQASSSAFNLKNSIFFSSIYPNLATVGPFRLTLSNITNPSVESLCGTGAAGDPVKFETQYVSRPQGLVYAKSYPISDQSNCLPLGKDRDAVKVIAPLYLRRGLMYTITLQVEEAAADLQLTPLSTFLIFEPKTVYFSNYQSRTVTLKVSVPRNVPKGEYLIQWKKKETGTRTNYLELQDTRVIVVDEATSASITPIPKVRVETIKYVWTGRVARDVLVTLDIEPAEGLVVEVKAKTTDNKLLGSVDGITYSKFPISLTFTQGQATQKFYIFADDGALDNVFTYSLSGTNAKAYDPKILETPFIIQTQLGVSNFQILSVQQVQILENKASFLAALSNVGTIFYLAIINSTLTPTQDQIISGKLTGVDSQFYKSGSVQVQKIEYASSFSSFVNLTNLASQTKYKIYFVARSAYGEYTNTTALDFKTLKVNQGAVLLIPSLNNISASNLIEALSIILPLSKNRLIFSGAEEFPAPLLNKSNQAIGGQLNGYRVIIAPDANNNVPSPLDIANTMLTKQKQDQLSAFIPAFYQKANIRVTSVERIAPRVIVTPTIKDIGYYTLTVKVELIEVGKLYAIAIQKSASGNQQPTSYQIYKGLMANNQKVDSAFYKTAGTDKNGAGEIVFDELRDFTEYNVYITAGNDVPYEPVDILEDSEVMTLEVKTLKNPNIGTFDEANGLYSLYFEKSSRRLTGMLWGAVFMLIAVLLL